MRKRISRSKLQGSDEIWNAVIDILSDGEEAESSETFQEACLLFSYYSAMESGGHESLLNGEEEIIAAIGMPAYVTDLTKALMKIDAPAYAGILKRYGIELWNAYKGLEDKSVDESLFYAIIEKADNAYYSLDNELQEKIENYFELIHTELIEVTED